MMRDVSIIIPTYNRPDDIASVLPYYLSQDDVLEIIIIDDGSSLSYENVIAKFSKDKTISIVYHKNRINMGAAASRNKGLELSRGTYVLWGEDDAYLSSNYVKTLKSKIQNNNLIAFGSIFYGIHPSMSETERQAIIAKQLASSNKLFNYELLEGYYRLNTGKDIFVPWAHALLLANKNAYNNVTYYEGYKVNGYREETDAQVQMTKNGYKILYTPDTCCYHFPARNEKGGQHSSSVLRYEFYKILNNNIFLNRHYSFLAKEYNLQCPKGCLKWKFAMNTIHSLVNRLINKCRRHLGLEVW